MFCDAASVGPFAADQGAIAAGDGSSLFKVLVATAMFQRRQDQQILRILRGMAPAVASEIVDAGRLKALATHSPCPHAKTVEELRERCDLAKDATTGEGTCGQRPGQPCHLKVHTVALKRYGHFGKVPTSIALSIVEAGAGDIAGLFERVVRTERTRAARAAALESALGSAWRVSEKIASMFLSAVTNPDLSPGATVPWAARVDWTRFVVIDSNVDLFLASIGYRGLGTYAARRAFVRAAAARVDLRRFDRRLRPFNPRIVQQAMYLFMSRTNRLALAADCAHVGASACRRCPAALSSRCALRRGNR
jgi:hypothetical protein